MTATGQQVVDRDVALLRARYDTRTVSPAMPEKDDRAPTAPTSGGMS